MDGIVRGLMASMIIGTIFGWIWLFIAFTNVPPFLRWIHIVISAFAIALSIWIIFIQRKVKQKMNASTATTNMFKTRSYRFIAFGEIFVIVIAVFFLKLANLQTFIPSLIAIIVALHFVLLGRSVRINYLSTMGWLMVLLVIICDISFSPMSQGTYIKNWVTVDSGMGVILWASVITTAVRLTLQKLY